MTRPFPSQAARRAPVTSVLFILAGICVLLANPLPAADQAPSEEPQEQATGQAVQSEVVENAPTALPAVARLQADAMVVIWDEETGTYRSPGSQLTPDMVERLQEIWDRNDGRKGGMVSEDEYAAFELPDGTIGARVPVSLWSAAIARIGDDGTVQLQFVDGAGVPEPDKRYQEPPPPLEVAEE